jgi:drug/metabolite transporter (DMT)-like permease
MLNSLTPVFTLLIGILFFKHAAKLINVIGIVIGFTGALALFYIGEQKNVDTNFNYGVYVIIATICYGLSVNIIQRTMKNVNAIAATTYTMIFIGIPAGIYLLFTDFFSKIITHEHGVSSLAYISILGIFGTAVSVIIFNQLVKRTSGLYASSVTYLIPIVAMFWGIADEEPVLWIHFVCMGVILTGVYLVTRK